MEQKNVLTGYVIVVVDRGFVYVGNVEYDGQMCVVTGAKNIRRWGTSRGLGELAEKGPQSETKLDEYGTVRIPAHAVISLIDTDKKLWT